MSQQQNYTYKLLRSHLDADMSQALDEVLVLHIRIFGDLSGRYWPKLCQEAVGDALKPRWRKVSALSYRQTRSMAYRISASCPNNAACDSAIHR